MGRPFDRRSMDGFTPRGVSGGPIGRGGPPPVHKARDPRPKWVMRNLPKWQRKVR